MVVQTLRLDTMAQRTGTHGTDGTTAGTNTATKQTGTQMTATEHTTRGTATEHTTRGTATAHSYRATWTPEGFLAFALLPALVVATFVVPTFAVGVALGVVTLKLGTLVGTKLVERVESTASTPGTEAGSPQQPIL